MESKIMNMKFLSSNIHLKTINDKGEISGYASVFNIVDGYNDAVLRGAFANSIKEFKSGKKPKLLWQHDTNLPIGVIEEIYEDDYGLFIKSQLILEIPKAKEIYLLLKSKAIDGFSIGYKIKDSYFNKHIQYLTDIDLLEVSIVTFPACKEAVVEEVKSCVNNDNLYIDLIKSTSSKIKNIINR